GARTKAGPSTAPFADANGSAQDDNFVGGAAGSAKRVVTGVRLRDGRVVRARATVVTTGTFLNGLIHCGEQQYPAGRSGEPASVLLGESLKKLGLRECRLKTGTPPRLDGRTIDWSRFEEQPGDSDPTPFSFRAGQRVSGSAGQREADSSAFDSRRTLRNDNAKAGPSTAFGASAPNFAQDDKVLVSTGSWVPELR